VGPIVSLAIRSDERTNGDAFLAVFVEVITGEFSEGIALTAKPPVKIRDQSTAIVDDVGTF